MIKYLKYLLLPVTIVIWFLLAYYSFYFAALAYIKIFTFRLFWILVLDSFIFGIVYFIAVGIPSLIGVVITVLFRKGIFIPILHSIAGILGIVLVISLFIQSPPMMFWEGGECFALIGMWKTAPLKTILVTLPLLGLLAAILYASIIFPIQAHSELDE